MVDIIFLGPPGSGKGTQAAALSFNLKIPAISIGDSLRKEVEAKTKIGELAKSYMDSGNLVPDKIVVGIIKNRITEQDCRSGFILDGFPRNIDQALALDSMLKSLDRKIDIAFNFEVDEEILIKRIAGRISCKKCGTIYNRYFKKPLQEGICDNCSFNEFENRADDNEVTVRNRLKVYQNSTFQLIEYYKKNNLLCSISALESVPLVFERLIDAVLKISQNK